MGSMVLLDLMGGVALLLWGLHMVQSGILRAFGPDLRVVLAKALGTSPSQVERLLETGKASKQLLQLCKTAEIAGCSLEFRLEERGKRF